MFTTSWSRGPFVHSINTTPAHNESRADALNRHEATVAQALDQLGGPDDHDQADDASPAPAPVPAGPAIVPPPTA